LMPLLLVWEPFEDPPKTNTVPPTAAAVGGAGPGLASGPHPQRPSRRPLQQWLWGGGDPSPGRVRHLLVGQSSRKIPKQSAWVRGALWNGPRRTGSALSSARFPNAGNRRGATVSLGGGHIEAETWFCNCSRSDKISHPNPPKPVQGPAPGHTIHGVGQRLEHGQGARGSRPTHTSPPPRPVPLEPTVA